MIDQETATKYEDLVIGDEDRPDRPPEEDYSGTWAATFVGVAIVDKPEWKVSSELQRGKDPEKVDLKQFRWDFTITEGELDNSNWSYYTTRSWNEKSNASAVAVALTGQQPSRSNGISTSQVQGSPCRLQLIYKADKARNYVEKVHPPRKGSTARQTASTQGSAERLAEAAVELLNGDRLPLTD